MRDPAVQLEREKRKTAREARNYEREKMIFEHVLTPNVIRLALISGIIAYSTHVTRSPHKESPINSALAFALPGIGIPMIAADAGIKDKYALAAISAAAIGYTTGQMFVGWGESSVFSPKENSLADKFQDYYLPFLG